MLQEIETGRVTAVHRTELVVTTENQDFLATIRGVFHADGDFPKVGDFVTIRRGKGNKAVIENVLERKSVIKRLSVHTREEQIIATNVDLIMIVMGVDGDFNLSRLERYLLLAKQSGIEAIVVLNKADALPTESNLLEEAKAVSGETRVLLVSALRGDGMDELAGLIFPNTTAVLLGSSGAGKSTITNLLLQEDVQAVKGIRESDSHGRHTTTTRQLFVLPNGGYLIDTPGMRELGLVDSDDEAEQEIFKHIDELAEECQFRNCDHEKSLGCAVLNALEKGEITERELKNFHKLQAERELQANKGATNSQRYQKQNQKRQQQKLIAIKRNQLNRGRGS